MFSNRELAQRLERTEGSACVEFARAHGGAEWMECDGVHAVFDGLDSPITQSFGLGLSDAFTAESLDAIENFFFERGSAAVHEVSPLAGLPTLELLWARRYRPVEISSVLYRSVHAVEAQTAADIQVRVANAADQELWTSVSAMGWGHEHPELLAFIRSTMGVCFTRDGSVSFLAEIDGRPGAAAGLCIHEGAALFAGAATIPELRRRGMQRALLQERLRYASEQGCQIAMIAAEAGSNSQRNAEREGFRIAYTRMKWRLSAGETQLTG